MFTYTQIYTQYIVEEFHQHHLRHPQPAEKGEWKEERNRSKINRREIDIFGVKIEMSFSLEEGGDMR